MRKLILIIPLLLAFLGSVSAQEVKKKTEKKVIVIKETKDENGKIVKERIEASGAEAEALIKKMNEDGSMSEKEVEIIITEKTKVHSSSDHKKVVNVEVIRNDNEDGQMIIKMNNEGDAYEKIMMFNLEDGRLPEDAKKKLDELGIDIDMDESDGKTIINVEEMDSDHDGFDKGSFFINLKKDGNGKAEVRSWKSKDGNMTPEMEELLKSGKIKVMFEGEDGKEENVFVFSDDPLPEVKVRLGVRITDKNGLLIEGLEENSVLKDAGLKSGDQITEINDFYIGGYEDLMEQLAKYNPEDQVSIRYIRDGKAQTVKVKLPGKE